jgi:hypothetical protein
VPKRLVVQLERLDSRKEADIQTIRERTAFTAPKVSVCLGLVLWLCCPSLIRAQEPASTDMDKPALPNSPEPKVEKDSNPALETTTRFVGYMTDSSIVFPDIASSEGPMTSGEKFRLFVNQSSSPPYFIMPLIGSAYNQARNSPKEYGQGWNAYGERYGESIARASSNSLFSTFILASAFHQDPRFFPQNRPSIWGSVKYSAQRLLVTRTNSGRDTFNTSQILGTFMSESLANVYLPGSQQGASKTFERVGTDMIWRFAGNMFKNYWPELFHTMKLNRLGVTPAKAPEDQAN